LDTVYITLRSIFMTIARVPLRDQVYQEVLARIHRGEVAPGARVRDTTLAQQLGVSRTPVREALLRLSREGVLDVVTGRGFRLRHFAREELRDVGGILASLEPLALRLVPEFPPEKLTALEDLARQLEQIRGDIPQIVEADDAWHRRLVEDCPNRLLLDLIATLRQVPRRYLHAYLREAGRLSLSTLHHGRVLEALRRGDRSAAAGLLERRWHRGIEEMEAWIK
jgi:DNA-binding GntR family transcriptional regulator